MRWTLTLILLAVLAGVPGCGPAEVRDAVLGPPPRPGMAARVVREVNRLRAEHGLAPLEPDPRLERIALSHSRDMARREVLTHRSRGGGLVQRRADAAGIDWRLIAENVGRNRGYDDPVAKAIDGWARSPGHRRIMLMADFTRTGVGVVRGSDEYWYFTQVFLVPMPE
jgi:uncharacterized protein YkwD